MKSWLSAVVLAVMVAGWTVDARAESGRQVLVHSDTPAESYMWTMTKDVFLGGLCGALIGGGVMLATGFEADPMIVAYAASGGMVAGLGFGIWEIADRRAQVRGPDAAASQAPGTRLVAWTLRF